jgi:hypothetical protein
MAETAQQRFIQCSRGRGTPRPLLHDADQAPGTVAGWVLLAILAIAVLFGVALLGFGVLTPGRPPQSRIYWAIDAALIGVVLFALLSALRVRLVRGPLPFSPGFYLFPTDLVDARSAHLRLWPLAALTGVALQDGGASGRREVVFTFLGEEAGAHSQRGRRAGPSRSPSRSTGNGTPRTRSRV